MKFLLWLVSRLPLSWLHAIGGALGLAAARLPGRYGHRLSANLRRAFPHATQAMQDEAARSIGRMVLEMPYFWCRKTPRAELVAFADAMWPELERLRAKGAGLIMLVPHLGCFEILPQAFAMRHPVTALYKRPNQRWARKLIEGLRCRKNLAMAPADARGVRMLVKALRRGEAVGILPDQVPPGGEGAWAPFFGAPAYTMTLVQRLQQVTGAPIAVICAVRAPRGGAFRGHLRVLEEVLPDSPEAAARTINEAVEALIAEAPTQYLWGYNRYKRPTGAPPPPPAAESAPPDA